MSLVCCLRPHGGWVPRTFSDPYGGTPEVSFGPVRWDTPWYPSGPSGGVSGTLRVYTVGPSGTLRVYTVGPSDQRLLRFVPVLSLPIRPLFLGTPSRAPFLPPPSPSTSGPPVVLRGSLPFHRDWVDEGCLRERQVIAPSPVGRSWGSTSRC